MPPAACHVDPAVSSRRSRSMTSVQPAFVRWSSTLAPTTPPPMTTAWADVFKELPSLRRAWSEVGRSVVGRSVVGRDAALGDPSGDEGLELLGDRGVHRWRLVRGQELLPDAVGLGGQLRRARLLPGLV